MLYDVPERLSAVEAFTAYDADNVSSAQEEEIELDAQDELTDINEDVA